MLACLSPETVHRTDATYLPGVAFRPGICYAVSAEAIGRVDIAVDMEPPYTSVDLGEDEVDCGDYVGCVEEASAPFDECRLRIGVIDAPEDVGVSEYMKQSEHVCKRCESLKLIDVLLLRKELAHDIFINSECNRMAARAVLRLSNYAWMLPIELGVRPSDQHLAVGE